VVLEADVEHGRAVDGVLQDDHAAVLPVHAFGATLAHIFRCGTAAVHPSAQLVGLRGSTHPEAVRIQKQSTCARARGARFMRTLHGTFLERLYSGNALYRMSKRRTGQGRRERAWWPHKLLNTSLQAGQPIRGFSIQPCPYGALLVQPHSSGALPGMFLQALHAGRHTCWQDAARHEADVGYPGRGSLPAQQGGHHGARKCAAETSMTYAAKNRHIMERQAGGGACQAA